MGVGPIKSKAQGQGHCTSSSEAIQKEKQQGPVSAPQAVAGSYNVSLYVHALVVANRLKLYRWPSLTVDVVPQPLFRHCDRDVCRAGATDFELEGRLVHQKGPWPKGPFLK